MLIFAPTSALTKVDLPTFGRPTTATKPLLCTVRLRSHFRQCLCSGDLLSDTPALPFTNCLDVESLYMTHDLKFPSMRRTCFGNDSVDGHSKRISCKRSCNSVLASFRSSTSGKLARRSLKSSKIMLRPRQIRHREKLRPIPPPECRQE